LYKLITIGYKDNLDCYRVLSLFFPLDHLDPTLTDHLSPYLSTCSIGHPL